MNDICLIVTYLGKLPHYFNIWMKSVAHNRNIDFIVITDQTIESNLGNLIIHSCDLNSILKRAENVIGKNVCLNRPYKLCDYRPLYGLMFREYLEGYYYWGHTDLDVVYGNLSRFLPPDRGYDKLYELGHLTMYKNSEKMNHLYLLKGGYSYEEMISSNDPYYFDEVAVREKCRRNGIEVYRGRDYADISPRRKRFTLSYDLLTEEQKKKNNFKHQVFYWENGRVYRAYLENNEIKNQEFNYIHFQKRKMEKLCPTDAESFFITNEGFIEKPPGLPSVDQIYAYNKYPGRIYELSEEAVFWIGEYKKRLINKFK